MKRFYIIPLLLLSLLQPACNSGEGDGYLELSGNLEAVSVTVSNKTAGTITAIQFDEGRKVEQGDTLAIIDTEAILLQLKQAKANREAIQAQYIMLKNGARKEDIAQVESIYKQTELSYKTSLNDLERTTALLKSGSATQKQYDDIAALTETRKLQMNAALENLNKLKSIARPEELMQAKARFDQAVAAEEIISKNYRDCFILSPVSGFITKSFFETGELVQPGASLFRVTNLEQIELIVYPEQNYIGRLQLNGEADISIDSFPDETFEGKIVYISPEAEFTPKNIQTKEERSKLVFAVKIAINNPQFRLKSGLPADARIYLK
ncbi:MAG: membrane protein [Ignavibacteriales bacterium]